MSYPAVLYSPEELDRIGLTLESLDDTNESAPSDITSVPISPSSASDESQLETVLEDQSNAQYVMVDQSILDESWQIQDDNSNTDHTKQSNVLKNDDHDFVRISREDCVEHLTWWRKLSGYTSYCSEWKDSWMKKITQKIPDRIRRQSKIHRSYDWVSDVEIDGAGRLILPGQLISWDEPECLIKEVASASSVIMVSAHDLLAYQPSCMDTKQTNYWSTTSNKMSPIAMTNFIWAMARKKIGHYPDENGQLRHKVGSIVTRPIVKTTIRLQDAWEWFTKGIQRNMIKDDDENENEIHYHHYNMNIELLPVDKNATEKIK